MPILTELKGLFSRKKPNVVDFSTSQAAGLSGKGDRAIEAKPHRTEGEVGLERRTPPKSGPDIEDVMSMVKRISGHLESQATRTQRLIECVERLPDALDALPEINRQNSRLLEVVNDYLAHARRRDDALNETLGAITHASTRQTEVLGLLQQQLDANSRSSDNLLDSLDGFRDALGGLADSNGRVGRILTDLSQSNSDREQELTRMLSSSQKWMIAAMVCCAAASLTAIGVAAFALFAG